MNNIPLNKALLVGHFSTVGDIACLEYVQNILDECAIRYDVCAFIPEVRKAIPQSISPCNIDSRIYSHFIFICGPCWPQLFYDNGINLKEFENCCRIGVNVSMVGSVQDWNPFHYLIERDSDRAVRPDLSFFQPVQITPVVAVCLIDRQEEYGSRQLHSHTAKIVNDFFAGSGLSRFNIDTRWPAARNSNQISSPSEFMSILSRVDILITNRLHGFVFGIKTGLPVVLIDSIAGGDKVLKQAEKVGWPCIRGEELTLSLLQEAIAWSIKGETKERVQGILGDLHQEGCALKASLEEAIKTTRLPLHSRIEDLQRCPPSRELRTIPWGLRQLRLRFKNVAQKLLNRI